MAKMNIRKVLPVQIRTLEKCERRELANGTSVRWSLRLCVDERALTLHGFAQALAQLPAMFL